MVGMTIGGDGMEKWDKFLTRLGEFPKVNESKVSTPEGYIEVKTYAIEADNEDTVKEAMIDLFNNGLGEIDKYDIWVRCLPTIGEVLTYAGEKTGKVMGHMRFAHRLKVSQ